MVSKNRHMAKIFLGCDAGVALLATALSIFSGCGSMGSGTAEQSTEVARARYDLAFGGSRTALAAAEYLARNGSDAPENFHAFVLGTIREDIAPPILRQEIAMCFLEWVERNSGALPHLRTVAAESPWGEARMLAKLGLQFWKGEVRQFEMAHQQQDVTALVSLRLEGEQGRDAVRLCAPDETLDLWLRPVVFEEQPFITLGDLCANLQRSTGRPVVWCTQMELDALLSLCIEPLEAFDSLMTDKGPRGWETLNRSVCAGDALLVAVETACGAIDADMLQPAGNMGSARPATGDKERGCRYIVVPAADAVYVVLLQR